MNEEGVVYTYNGMLFICTKNEILPFAAWMHLKSIMLSEINQTKTNTVCHHLHIKSNQLNKLVNLTKKKQSHKYREQTSGYQVGEERKGSIRIGD